MYHAGQLQTGIKSITPKVSLTESMATPWPNRDNFWGNEDPWRAQTFWEPLVRLLPKFKHLTDVVAQVRGGIPVGIVATLEQSHPECRLHLPNFTFRSLHEDITNPDERALVTSSNLHSISVEYRFRDHHGMVDYNEAAALRTVALAPNLKHVRILGVRPRNSAGLRAMGRPFEPWKGFIPPIDEADRPKSKLVSLELTGAYSQLTPEKLAIWQEAADLSGVKMLSCSISWSNIPDHVSMSNTFSSLTDLTLSFEPPKRGPYDVREHAIQNFLSSLNSLTSLSLSGPFYGPFLSAIAERHGATLEKLTLRHTGGQFPTPPSRYRMFTNDLRILASACLQLTELSLYVQRSLGDRTEIETYEAIDCRNSSGSNRQVDPGWDDFEKAEPDNGAVIPAPIYRNGHLKRAIVNSALDETLARSIYALVSSKRSESTLDVLEVKTYGGGSFDGTFPGDLKIIVDHVSRNYRFERQSERQGTGFMSIIELSKGQREAKDAYVRTREGIHAEHHEYGSKVPQDGAWAVFRRLWPFEEHEDWRDVWRSWPLGYQKV
ncbi:hypothetical protein SLS60_002558 [Paraconiothyrium brasiliense]|uniref:Uncharacterized protein n=1 Tax=Paraconiothyrium brasiliense TaxID=300254 RepID=A0ABR3RT65_9PLEO